MQAPGVNVIKIYGRNLRMGWKSQSACPRQAFVALSCIFGRKKVL